jgi:hypothetical protein
MAGRRERRERKTREKDKARKFLRQVWQCDELAGDEAYVGKRARTRVPCSCHNCGNPRRTRGKKYGLTLQERRAEKATATP